MGRILVVEDSPTQAHLLLGLLGGEGFEVEVAPDGEQGLALFHASAFHLVITDVVMPGLSGFELCRTIKGHPGKGRVPVILLTSLSDPHDIIRGIECGADSFITKPFQPESLVGRVRTLLASRAQRAESKTEAGIEVVFLGETFTISSGKEQVLDLLIAAYEDIFRNSRELSERARSSEERYHSLMEHANDAIFLLNSLDTVLEVNRRAEEILGRPRTGILGQPFAHFVPPGDLDSERQWFEQLLKDGSVRAGNVRLQRGDGRAVPVELSASLVEVAGERVALVLAHDMTEWERLERQLRQAQKMEAIGTLAGGVAHDFNNLLTVINGYSEMLLTGLPQGDPRQRMLGEVKRAGDRAASLTRQLLAFSRQQVIAPVVLDLNAVVADTSRMLQRLIGEDVELETALEPAIRLVKADPGQVEQVLMNLAVNARDAMPQGGRLTVETKCVHLDSTRPEVRPGRYVMLAVSDTGCGMTEEVKARVFEPFFTTKEPGKGTGLGLATVYGIVKQAGGYVYVDSEPGQGTTFKVCLPEVKSEVKSDMTPAGDRRASRGNETLLLVEDDVALRSLSRLILQASGYTVLEAGHGVEALRIAEQHRGPLHLLVSDVVMPRLGGRELAERMAASHPGIKVLYVSGYTDDAVVRHGVLQEKVHLLQKPFSPTALAQKVREVLDSPARRQGRTPALTTLSSS